MVSKRLKRLIFYLSIPITVIINAIDFINLGSAFLPAMVKWVDFFLVLFDLVADLRDFLLTPLTFSIKWLFDWSMPTWLRSYLFLGIMSFNFNYLSLKIAWINLLKKYCIDEKNLKRAMTLSLGQSVIFGLLWPIAILLSLEPLRPKSKDHEKNKLTDGFLYEKSLMGFYVVTFAIILIFTTINFVIISIS